MNLIVDIGNTNLKYFVFSNDNSVFSETINISVAEKTNEKLWLSVQQKFGIKKAVISSVVGYNNIPVNEISNTFEKVIHLGSNTKIPVTNLYKTPETLGQDRIAGVVAANFLYPGKNIMVIDAGTAITYDIITCKAEYLGGNISPGLEMRFKALNSFTKNLPLLSKKDTEKFIGNSTDEAIILGVQNGLIFEIQSYIDEFIKLYQNTVIIFTGGDTFFFDKKLKRTIFAIPNLLSIGLNRILEYNV